MKLFWQITNIASVVFALVLNALVGAGLLGLPAINDMSDKYATLLTPAGYAFSIWSLVYVLIVTLTVYQARDIFRSDKKNDLPQKMGPFFALANICNGLWTYIFVQELITLSVVLLVILTASLFVLLYRLRIAIYDAPLQVIACVWWPLMIYTGWVTAATVVNSASWLRSVEVTVSATGACITLILLGAGLLLLLARRSVRELVIASTWGVAAIGVRQLQTGESLTTAYCAFAVCTVLVMAVLVHGYRNRHGNPVTKFLARKKT